MTTEKAIAAALEPLVDDLLALEKRFAAFVATPGPDGAPGAPGKDADPAAVARALSDDEVFMEAVRGDDGADGTDGTDGAGLDAPRWVPGDVYRKDAVVSAYMGQHYRAVRDTAAVPGDSDQWARVGSGGFRHRGAHDKDTTYADGDLFANGFNTFVVIDGAPRLMAGRGAVGAKGEPGARGDKGDTGRDGATIVAAQVEGFRLVLVQQNGDGSVDHIEADFGPAYRALADEMFAAALPEIQALREEVAALKRARKVAA